jgi:hypothetical protein
MSAPYDSQSTILSPNNAPTALGGDSAKYQSTGGNGYGFDGKEIRAGVMEVSTYKTGGSRNKTRRSRRQNRKTKTRGGKRSDTKRSDTKRSDTKRSDTKRSDTKRSDTKRRQTKRR